MERTNTTTFKFFSLGGSNEVGRSCHILQYKGKTVMLDAGIHPAYQGLASLPFYDEFDLSKIDILLISHFHLDHAASLPYVMQRTNFQGRVFMTHPTKAIYRWLLRDFVRVTSIGSSSSSMGAKDEGLFSDEDLVDSFDKIETVDYHSTVDVNGIKFTAFHAGHVLGAAMFQIEIAGLRVLFTGDYSREVDRHLNSAEVPPLSSNVLIVESTFGTATHEPRLNRERKLTQLIHSTVIRGGRVLLPVFALGRAQEIMLILDEYWSQHADELGGGQVPIFYASNLAKKCMSVFQTYVNMMNDDIRKKFRDSQTNPFIFKNISYLRNLEDFQDFGPSVMLASPGMLQSGLSRDLLERWCPEDKNLVLITGYSIEGTMAKFIMLEPDTIPSINNPEVTIPRRCQVEEISFAAHVDFQENLEFIEKISAPNIILVHGEANPMGRLKSALLSNFASLKGTENEVHVFNPRNCVEVDLEFQGVKVAKAVGNIVNEIYKEESVEVKEEIAAKIEPIKEEKEGDLDSQTRKDLADVEEHKDIVVSGILVSDDKNFELDFLSLSDLREHHPDLSTTILRERQSVRVNCKKELIYWHILQMFGEAEVLQDDDKVTNQEPKVKQEGAKDQTNSGKLVLQIMGDIKLTIFNTLAVVEWTQDLINDTVADSIIAILMNVDSAPASIKLSSHSCDDHDHNNVQPYARDKIDDEVARVKQISRLFKEQFGDCFTLFLNKDEYASNKEDTINGVITIGKNTAKVDFNNMKILECNSNPLKGRVESLLNIGGNLVTPLC
ncbi:cleavage polyadenylation factor subunit YSH1 [Saccharomyces paradoxus]|uniref:Endoribonuclease YSH1 n=1 Tax=Saccharomyces paradoxus TaxID=27291 RepID=A0A8B8UW80_SACPA|nr:Ysh1 [Saccharomyces paradoxus]QHS74993.1 Ysh1 [Saccharomyces paradoxus]